MDPLKRDHISGMWASNERLRARLTPLPTPTSHVRKYLICAELGRGWGWGPFTESRDFGFEGGGSGGTLQRPGNSKIYEMPAVERPPSPGVQRAWAPFALGSGAGTAPDPEEQKSSYKKIYLKKDT